MIMGWGRYRKHRAGMEWSWYEIDYRFD